ncbi:MAG: molybdenum cofactor guanylyltransferase [Cyanobacteria bacterium CRU_2_1]|nr:molybdenum cofactor guanylyltransferase [Cyanobacteria bacterium RU_5_0]NJR57599.1 molybdenum cofactor guanylyltransferase [Cyanobacteria bacterium CRU_2_1]
MSSLNVSLSAIVLAGGQSSRMGRDKALVEVGGIPLLQRVCQVAQELAERVYVVTPWQERYQDWLDGGTVTLDGAIEFVQEIYQSGEASYHGPLVGFAQGLIRVQTDWVLLLACDLPQLNVEILRRWRGELSNVSEETIALLPQHPQGWWEPLCGFYRRRCSVTLEKFIQEGGRSFQRWLVEQSVQALPLSDAQMLFNCNTPDDLKMAEQALGKVWIGGKTVLS